LYTFLYKYCWQYLYTSITIIHFKRSHIENKFRQLDKFTFNLSIFVNEMFSLQNPFSNWIVNIRLSIIYLLYACRVQSVVPPLCAYIVLKFNNTYSLIIMFSYFILFHLYRKYNVAQMNAFLAQIDICPINTIKSIATNRNPGDTDCNSVVLALGPFTSIH
jgi:hypothetical protein